MTAATTEYTLALSEDERVELLGLLDRELADLHVECRRTDTPAFHDQLRDEEMLLRALAAKVRQLRQPGA
jgi:hypothetical protein